jgi:hypothetical protein
VKNLFILRSTLDCSIICLNLFSFCISISDFVKKFDLELFAVGVEEELELLLFGVYRIGTNGFIFGYSPTRRPIPGHEVELLFGVIIGLRTRIDNCIPHRRKLR